MIGLRNDGTISDELLHRLEHELDVEALHSALVSNEPGHEAHTLQYRKQSGTSCSLFCLGPSLTCKKIGSFRPPEKNLPTTVF